MKRQILHLSFIILATIFGLSNISYAEQTPVIVGSEGYQWPPVTEDNCYYEEELLQSWGASAYGHPSSFQWAGSGYPAQLFSRARALAIEAGGVSQFTRDDFYGLFTVSNTGNYVISMNFEYDRTVWSGGLSFIGDNAGFFDLAMRAGIYEVDASGEHHVAGGYINGTQWTSDQDNGVTSFLGDSASLFFDSIGAPVLSELLTVADITGELFETGKIQEAGACLAATSKMESFSVYLEAGKVYKWILSSEAACTAEAFTLLGGNLSMVDTTISFSNVSIFEEKPKIELYDNQNNLLSQIGFGSVPVGASDNKIFKIKNTGQQNLSVSSWISSNGVFTLTPTNPSGSTGDVVLASGESTEVTVTFTPQAEIAYAGQIEIASNDPVNPTVYIDLSGTGMASADDILVTANPSSTNLGGTSTITAYVKDPFGNPVGSGHLVHFYTLSAGSWGSYDHVGDGGVYEYTDSGSNATVTWTTGEIGANIITAISEYGTSGNATVSVGAGGTYDFSTSIREVSDNGSSANYNIEVYVTDDGQPVINSDISFATSRGTVTSADPWTSINGHAEANIQTTTSGPVTITITMTINGQAGYAYGYFQVGPPPQHPAGVTYPTGGSINKPSESYSLFDINYDSSKVAVARNTSYVTVFDTSTWQSYSQHLPYFDGREIYSIAFNHANNYLAVGARTDRNGLYNAGSSSLSTLREWQNDDALYLGVPLSLEWIGSTMLFGHNSTSTNIYEFSTFNTSGSLLGRLSYGPSDEDITKIAYRPGYSSQAAAISDTSEYVYLLNVSGSSISVLNSWAESIITLRGGLAWHPDGNKMALGSTWNYQIKVYTFSGNSVTANYSVPCNSYIDHIAFSSDGNYMAAAGGGTTSLRIYDTSSSNPGNWYELSNITLSQGCYGLAWLHNTHTLVVAEDSQIQLVFFGDNDAPSVSVSSPVDGQTVTSDTITVNGMASDDSGIQKGQIRINGEAWQDMTINPNGSFSHDLPLVLGENQIEVLITDNAGWTFQTPAIAVNRSNDTAAPIITNVTVSPSAARPVGTVTVSADITDVGSGVDDSTVIAEIQKPDESNIATIPLVKGAGSTYSGTWNITGMSSGAYYVDIKACDLAVPSYCAEKENARTVVINEPPALSFISIGSDVAIMSGQALFIDWTVSDTDSDCLTSLYLDCDGDSSSGMIPIPGAIGLPEATTTFELDTQIFDYGTYYLIAVVNDEYGSSEVITAGKIIIKIPGDYDLDDDVDMDDLYVIASHWLDTCGEPDWCDRSDFDHDSTVDFSDFARLASHWLEKTGNIADMEGIWQSRNIWVPQNDKPDDFGYDNGVFACQSDGSFTGTMTDFEGNSWPESGSASITKDGIVTITFMPDYEEQQKVLCSGKDVMIGNFQTPDWLLLDIIIKKGTSYTIANLEGIWYVRGIKTQKNGYSDSFGYETGIFTFQSDGSFNANWVGNDGSPRNESGTASIDPNGVVTFDFGADTMKAVLDASKDVMVDNWQLTDAPENEVGIDIFVKKGNNYTLADLEGSWYFRGISTQKNGLPDDYGFDTGIFNIESDGSFSGMMTSHDDDTWSESGTATMDSNGIATLNFTTDGGGILQFALNANKDVMISNSQDANSLYLDVLVKGVTDVEIPNDMFNSNSNVITNPWLGLVNIGDNYSLAGYGNFSGATRSYSLIGSENVMGVNCVILKILGHGQNPPVEYYDVRIAQDTDGNLRFLKIDGNDYDGSPIFWQVDLPENASIFLPANPAVGQVYPMMDTEYHEVIALNQTVPQMTTGAGPYTGCMQYRWGDTSIGNMDDNYLCPGYGFVKEIWNIEEAGSTYGWERIP